MSAAAHTNSPTTLVAASDGRRTALRRLRSRHLAVLAEAFCFIGATPKTESFGTYTVDVVVALFGRVADLQVASGPNPNPNPNLNANPNLCRTSSWCCQCYSRRSAPL